VIADAPGPQRRLSVGVALCTYNGARYLQAQLDSIAAQTVLPDRLVAVDDASRDGSWDILQRWRGRVPFEVELHRNEANVGVVRNFERASATLPQDIVFFADQDDLWYPRKVETFLGAFSGDPSIGLLHSDADLVDAAGAPLGRTLLQALLMTRQEREHIARGEAWRVYARRNLVTGAACAVRREVLQQAMPFSDRWVHDEWLAWAAALVSRVAVLDEPTMAYRLHGANTIGLPIPTLRWRVRSVWRAMWQASAARQLERADKLTALHAHAQQLDAPLGALDCIAQAAGHARFRATLPRNILRRWPAVVQESGRGGYAAWSSGRQSVWHDLILGR
jgi:glycosyltransferase involved in cell wall biosynthesis